MRIRIHSNLPAALAVLAASLWTTQVSAQAFAPAKPATPATLADAAPSANRSAFEGYQRHTDEKTVNWKEANDNVGRIGGWREYARQASQAQMPEDAARRDLPEMPVKP